jgi:hypothetical protein
MQVAIDLDSRGEVIGIEAIGLTQFTLRGVLKLARVKVPEMDFSRTQYAPAELVPN